MDKFILKLLVITTLLAGWEAAYTQATGYADSLAQVLRSMPADTNRVLLLDNLAWELKMDDALAARTYLEEALRLSEELNYRRGLSKAWNDLGVVENIQGNHAAARQAFENALRIRETLRDSAGIASVYNNLANVQDRQGDFAGALKNYHKSLRLRQALKDTVRMARVYYNMSDLHERMGNYPEAMELVFRFLIYTERTGNEESAANGYNILGNIHFELGNYQEALRWYRKAYVIFDRYELAWEKATALNNIANILGDMAEHQVDSAAYDLAAIYFDSAITLSNRVIALRRELSDEPGEAEAYNSLGVVYKDRGSFYKKMNLPERAEKNWQQALAYFEMALDIFETLGNKKRIIEVYNGIGDVYRRQNRLAKALKYTNRYLRIARDIGDAKYIQNAYKDLSKIYREKGDYRQAFEYRKAYDELRYQRLNEQRVKEFARRQTLYGDQQKEIEIERQQQRNALLDAQLKRREAEIQRADAIRNSLIGGGLGLLLLALLLYNRNRIKTKANRDLEEKNAIIEKERKRSDKLLKNILPAQTAEELKEHGRTQARRYEAVTVLFSDFKNFTAQAENMTAEALVAELDDCFRAFDDITRKYDIEKIKTIGDSYMCVAGLPEPDEQHAVKMVRAAQEMQTFMKLRKAEHPETFEMRIGIHSGPVVAGVVGSRKFAYDVWGDTVNLAARMESSGTPGKINLSEQTYQLVKEDFRCTSRGKVAAKNKGEVEMYFVEDEKSD